MLLLVAGVVAIVSLAWYLTNEIHQRKPTTISGTITITGKYLPVGNPCTTRPCLPGIVYAVLADDRYYYLTVEGHWIWESQAWDGYTPKEGDYVRITGYLSKRLDVNGNTFYEIEVVSLKPA